MKLWATSDLHVGFEENRRAVEALDGSPDDWLIVAGDTGESVAHLEFVLKTLTPRFAQIVWTAGQSRSVDAAIVAGGQARRGALPAARAACANDTARSRRRIPMPSGRATGRAR